MSNDVIESHVEQDGNKFSIMIEFDEAAANSLFAATLVNSERA